MSVPETLRITVTREPTTDLCLCADNGPFKYPADHRIETQFLDAEGTVLTGAGGVEYRCGDGADLVIDQAKLVGRALDVVIEVRAASNTDVDRDLVTHQED